MSFLIEVTVVFVCCVCVRWGRPLTRPCRPSRTCSQWRTSMCQRPSSTANPQSRSNPLPLTPTWARQTSVRDELISRRLRASTSLWVVGQMRAQKALLHGPHTLKPEMILSPSVSYLLSAEIQRVLKWQQSHCETAGQAWPSEADARWRWDWLCHTLVGGRSGGNRWVSIIYIKLNTRSINKRCVVMIQEFLTSVQYHKTTDIWYHVCTSANVGSALVVKSLLSISDSYGPILHI